MWSFFDRIYCINLKERKDRHALSKKVFEKHNIPVTYFITERHKNGDRGCFNSHVTICKEAVEKGFKRILIFEDDVVDTNELNSKNLNFIFKSLRKIPNWQIFYFGCFPDIRYGVSSVFGNIYKTRAYGAHAYGLNTSIIHRIANLKWEGRSYDSYLMESEHYAYLPRMFDQRAISSDIPRNVNFINNFSFLKKVCLDLNEWYARYIGIGVWKLLWVILIFIGISCLNR